MKQPEQKQVNFLLDNRSYRLDIDYEFKTITLYEVFESKDDVGIFKYISSEVKDEQRN